MPQEEEHAIVLPDSNLLATSGRIAWLADLDTTRTPAKNYRRTSIICTIGPKTNSVEMINKLRTVGRPEFVVASVFCCPSLDLVELSPPAERSSPTSLITQSLLSR
jgi:hypothetical protein